MRGSTDFEKVLLYFNKCLSADYIHTDKEASFAVERSGERAVIYFEASNGLPDWKHNFRFASRPYTLTGEDYRCHRGFLTAFLSALPFLEKTVRDESIKEITVVGYSHGAALALLCYDYISHKREDLTGSLFGYGFGTPRVFKGGISREARLRFRDFTYITNCGDIVTHLPFRLFGYRHVKRQCKIGKRGKYSMIDAHRPENYQSELQSAAVEERRKEFVYDG
ncbi:MAG: lipase family protein [Clostridia bacterium]|nr:lipase family protein [Clostridia bacterium]